jgi:hypothetical protein
MLFLIIGNKCIVYFLNIFTIVNYIYLSYILNKLLNFFYPILAAISFFMPICFPFSVIQGVRKVALHLQKVLDSFYMNRSEEKPN